MYNQYGPAEDVPKLNAGIRYAKLVSPCLCGPLTASVTVAAVARVCQAGSIFGDHGEDLQCAHALNMQANLLSALEDKDRRKAEVVLHERTIALCQRQPPDCPQVKEFQTVQVGSAS